MSVDLGGASLDRDHDDRQQRQLVEEAFRAHTSPAFEALVRQEIGATTDREPHTSLATCEKVPDPSKGDPTLSVGSGEKGGETVYKDPPGKGGAVRGVSDATTAIRMAISRDRDRQRKVIALIGVGEVAHAKRLAMCRRKSVQLECPQLAGGCGSDGNYVPASCGSPLCPDCASRRMGQKAGQYRPVVKNWDHPTMLRLSLPNRVDPGDQGRAVEALRGAFGRLRRRKIPPTGSHQGKRWVWSDDGGEPADHYWKAALMAAGERRLAKYIETKYVNQGKWIPVEEMLRSGFYGIDIKQGSDGTLNVHAHVLADCPYLPQAALSSLWDDIIDAPAVDVRRVDERGSADAETALMETIGYAAKAPEFETPEAEAEYFKALKGAKMVQPFGELHGNTPDPVAALECADCGVSPAYWNYKGTVDGCYHTVTVAGDGSDGDRPPPGGGGADA